MENLLLDYLPTTVMVDGVSYPVDTNFRAFIIFEKILCDDSLEDGEKLSAIINMFYWGDDKPRNIEAAFRKIYELYLCGKEPPKQQRVKKDGNVAIKKQPVFDYEQDAPFIYAAFLAQYRSFAQIVNRVVQSLLRNRSLFANIAFEISKKVKAFLKKLGSFWEPTHSFLQ